MAAADRNFPQWADSVHTVQLLLEHRPTRSHLFFFLFVSEYTSKRWKGKAIEIWWQSVSLCRYTVLQVDTLAIVNWTQTVIKETAALYHQKDSFIL